MEVKKQILGLMNISIDFGMSLLVVVNDSAETIPIPKEP